MSIQTKAKSHKLEDTDQEPHVSTASDQNLRDVNVPAFGAMKANQAQAANEDHLPHAPKPAPGLNDLSADLTATGGWDAYDVWRRLIKDARDRRQS